MTRRDRRLLLLNGLLCVVCLALGVTLHHQLSADPRARLADAGASMPAAEAASAASETIAPPSSPAGPDGEASTFDEIVERPLFVRTRRRPEVAEAPAPEAEPTPAPAVVLRGVVHSGSARRVLLEQESGQPLLRLKEGESLDGWEIVTIRPRRLILRQGEQTVEVLMLPPQTGTP